MPNKQINSNDNLDENQYLTTNNLHESNFDNKEMYIETLLQEANIIIIQIDNGNLNNTREIRNFASWRLKRAEKQLELLDLKHYRIMLTSLWSQLYRLEHTQGDTHPLITKIRSSLYIK